MLIHAKPAENTAVTPTPSKLLRRRCACGGTPGPDGECEQCRRKRSNRQRDTANRTILSDAPTVAPEMPRSPGRSPVADARGFVEPRFGHDFGRVRVLAAGEDRPDRPIPRLLNGESDCSPTWFGDTRPETDPSGGSFTGRLIVTYNDAALKDPCVRECVELHESVHVQHLTPIVKRIHECDVAAGSDWDKKGKCNEMATRELAAVRARSECEAYRRSFTCLTLKILDAKNPCSKPPHREEVQKHRGYEGCEMRRQCGEAGTPELGVPNA